MPTEGPVLGIDCSGASAGAALTRGGVVIASRAEVMTSGHAERLVPLIETLLDEARLTWRDLAAIGVGTGPGNFTGLRIAIAAARGLALALDVPAAGVGAFEVLAHGLPRPVLASVPAPRHGATLAVVSDAGTSPPETAEAGALPRTLTVPAGVTCVGHEAAALAEAIGGRACAPIHAPAEAAALIGADRARRGAARPAPAYVRPPAAAPAEAPPALLE